MMAKHIFQQFSNETEPIVDLALSILDKHIDDKEKQVDNTDLIRQYNDEKEKLQKRLDNLIEMRADGEITKEIFQTKSSEIKSRIQLIDDELAQLGSEEEKKQSDYTHEEKISLLKYHLLQTVYPSDGKKVSEGVLRAFVSKIVAHEDTLDWYLRFRPDDNTATGEPQKIAEFTFTLENAKEYIYSFSPQRRVLKWTNIKAAVYI